MKEKLKPQITQFVEHTSQCEENFMFGLFFPPFLRTILKFKKYKSLCESLNLQKSFKFEFDGHPFHRRFLDNYELVGGALT